jgi:hypothetical protein
MCDQPINHERATFFQNPFVSVIYTTFMRVFQVINFILAALTKEKITATYCSIEVLIAGKCRNAITGVIICYFC